MIHINRFNESIAVHKSIKPEKLPHSAELLARGYRVARINDEEYAFDKNYEEDDEIYWLGKDTKDFTYGKKYLASISVINNRENLPFYSIYSKCDSSPTDEQKKMISDRDKEIKKRMDQREREIEALKKKKMKKKKK